MAQMLRHLHRLTRGWPQRPGWRSSTDLLDVETGTKVDLGAMPREGVARCRAAWARLAGRETCVVHGDPNPGNIRLTADRVAMIDWDESHVDVPDLDLVLPHNAADLAGGAYDIAAQASAAWEAAVCGTMSTPGRASPRSERSEDRRRGQRRLYLLTSSARGRPRSRPTPWVSGRSVCTYVDARLRLRRRTGPGELVRKSRGRPQRR